MTKILSIYGQNHKGSTYLLAKKSSDKLQEELKKKNEESVVEEFFLPRDFSSFCLGCSVCFKTDITNCPHYKEHEKISKAILEADVLIFASPVYVFHVTGAMKNFLDHFGVWWVVHRLRPEMSSKIALVLTTAAGAGMKSASKDICDSLEMWGVRKIFKLGLATMALSPGELSKSTLNKIETKTDKISKKLSKNIHKRGMNRRAKGYFYFIRFAHRHFMKFKPDYDYWEERGWHGKRRPWKL